MPRHVAVVGSNGKTSTATFLGRLLRPHVHVGVFTSPHLERWSERVTIDGVEVDVGDLADAVERLHERGAAASGLRFFDLLTLAAEEIFAAAGVEIAVVEAGIGGRLDPVRLTRPELVALTRIDFEHTELLGDTREAILREKLAVGSPGAHVVAGSLGELGPVALDAAHELGLTIELGPAERLRPFQRENARLARRVAEVALGARVEALDTTATEVRGRFEIGVVEDVPFVADVAHNAAAWSTLFAELCRSPRVAVVALTHERPVEALAEELARDGLTIATVATTVPGDRGVDPEALCAALDRCNPEPDRPGAFRRGLDLARSNGALLVVFGATYVVGEFLAWARERGYSPKPGS